MKNYLLLLVSFFIFCFSTNAQVQKYSRVKILTDDNGLSKLASLGVTVDHGEYKKGQYFISEFSDAELKTMRDNGFKCEVLINDMAAYYVARNKNVSPTDVQPDGSAPAACTYATPKNFRLGTMGGFYTLADMLKILDTMRMKYPNLISVKKVASNTTTAEGRSVYYVRISNNPDTLQDKPKILYTALHHAREPESLTQLMIYIWYILENYNNKPGIASLVNSCEMYFVPCVNPDGYVYNQTTNPNGGGFWRKNRRNNGDGSFGVDLNRNYGYNWGYNNNGSSPSTFSDTYRGTADFSEPETQILRDFCVKYNFKIALNNHSYSNVLIYPWGYTFDKLTKDSTTFKNYAVTLTQCNQFQFGTPNQTVGYTANGTSDDWMYGEKNMKPKIFAMTPETGSSNDGFWPSINRIIPLAKGNLDMNINAAKFAATFAEPVIAGTENFMKAQQNKSEIAILQNSPNPCRTFTVIKYSLNDAGSKTNYTLHIFNTFGTKVKAISLQANQNSVTLNTTDMQAGIYYYNIGNLQNNSKMMKLMVIK